MGRKTLWIFLFAFAQDLPAYIGMHLLTCGAPILTCSFIKMAASSFPDAFTGIIMSYIYLLEL